jgi:methylated-DNA-[protein]-cysteine S-methyltransferase
MNFYTTIATLFGYAGIVYQKTPFQLIKIVLPCADRQHLLASIGKNKREPPNQDNNAEKIANLIQNYFRGVPITPPWGLMRMEQLTKLQQSVLHETASIPYGHQKSYKEIGAMIGRPKAFRFVGTTLSRNPFPIIVPCHRVIKSDGSYGQFGGGSEMKRKLIELETASLLKKR